MAIIHSILKMFKIPYTTGAVTIEMLRLLAPNLNIKASQIKSVKAGTKLLIKAFRAKQILDKKFDQPIIKGKGDAFSASKAPAATQAGGVSGDPQVQKFLGGFQANAPTGVQPHELKSALDFQSEFLQSKINELQETSVNKFLKEDEQAQNQWNNLVRENDVEVTDDVDEDEDEEYDDDFDEDDSEDHMDMNSVQSTNLTTPSMTPSPFN